jgi:integrase
MASVERRPWKDGDGETWRVVWRENGRKQSENFTTEAEAEWFAGVVRAPGGDRWPDGWVKGFGMRPADPDAETFRAYAERTIAARLRADERTKDDYRRMLARHVHPIIGGLTVDRVDRFQVAKIAQAMIDAGKAAKTVANVHGLLSSILSDAVSDGLIPRNPAVGALPDLPGVKGEEMVFLTKGEFAHLASELPDRWRPLARLLAGTGLRWSEATALQVQDIDLLGKRVLHVRRAWKRRGGYFTIGEPKTKRSRRTLDLSGELVELLIPLVAAKAPHELVFTTREGHPVRHANFYQRVWRPSVARARVCSAHRAQRLDREAAARRLPRPNAGLKDTTPCGCPGTLAKQPRVHDLRHTQASWLIDAGVSLPDIQRRLGHESIQTTIDRYGHPSGSRDAINAAIDAALREPEPVL